MSTEPGSGGAPPQIKRKTLRIINPSLQGKLIGCALLLSVGTACVQFVALNLFFSTMLMSPAKKTGAQLSEGIWQANLWGLGTAVIFAAPVAVLLMILVSMRIAGPAYRFETDLNEIADGGDPRSIRIREGDEFGGLCDAINRVVTQLDSVRRKEEQKADSPEASETKATVDA